MGNLLRPISRSSYLLPRMGTLPTRIWPAILMLAVLAISVGRANAECPGFGADTTCGMVITVTNAGANALPTGQGPYDSIEDTLVGVVNKSNLPIKSLVLRSNLVIFGFDGDGIDTYGAPSNAMDNTGYGGPNAYFTNYSADPRTGTVNFIVPIAANGGTAYFSLENALGSATACSTIINNALKKMASGKNICATFTPNQSSGAPPAPGMPGYTLSQAAQLCGFKDFDWTQKVTVSFDPSSFYARNLGGAFDPKIIGPVRLTSKRDPVNDPPQGGGYADGFGGDATPDNSYPFYYDPNVDLPGHESGSVPVACTLTASAGSTLTMHDAPADTCLPGGGGPATLHGTPFCTDPVLAPGATAEPKGSFTGFTTELAGVNFDGSATPLGILFTWTSNNNGTTGKVSLRKTELPADGNGTGGVTITSVNELTTYGGITVIGVNGAPPGAPATLTSGNACNGVYSGTFNGNLTISAGQDCTFINGYITGDVVQAAGENNLVLSGVLIGGNVQIVGSGTFSIGPSTAINGDLQIQNIPAGTAQNQVCGSTVYGDLQFQNNGSAVLIGSATETSCLGNTIDGNLMIQNNTAPTIVIGNTVTGNLHDQNNKAPTQVFNNIVGNNLHCQQDVSITGGGNTARQKQGQCTEF
jgi:hypothetical protein